MEISRSRATLRAMRKIPSSPIEREADRAIARRRPTAHKRKDPGGCRILRVHHSLPEMVCSLTVATATVCRGPALWCSSSGRVCVQPAFDLTAPSIGWTLSNMPGFSSEAALIDEVQQRLVRKFSHVTQRSNLHHGGARSCTIRAQPGARLHTSASTSWPATNPSSSAASASGPSTS
jgi:hypothetical protein